MELAIGLGLVLGFVEYNCCYTPPTQIQPWRALEGAAFLRTNGERALVHEEIVVLGLVNRFGCCFSTWVPVTRFVWHILHSKNPEVAAVEQDFANVLLS